ncbi:MAG: cellulase family glycosylhydrolase [Muribaculaceae bacterium]|nr:cellulase family glycosylhydrolase [Muribaculaceae bacterium]
MKKIFIAIGLAALALGLNMCRTATRPGEEQPQFVSVADGEFMIGDSVYRYVGTNFWYGAILASTGRGGDRERLTRELDLLQATGIDNVRVLVGGDGAENVPSHIMPVLQTAPGVYNDTILEGLDYLMAELEKRDMKAVLFLNNAWEWSGGYGTYLEWAGAGPQPNPAIDGYPAYMQAMAQFVHNDSARTLAMNHARTIASRTNRYTGKPYSQSPALMSWQVANEPRAFAADSATKAAFADYVLSTARVLKEVDPNHLVSTGSEGIHGCEYDLDLWRKIHEAPEIDYGILHLWPYNWSWVTPETLTDSVDYAFSRTIEYIRPHHEAMKAAGKPLVLEEFGYPRDGMALAPGTPVTGRDAFYGRVFDLIATSGMINGCNFWGWGGYAQPAHERWQPWDDYTCDPAQEPQGLNSVFAADTTTLAIIRGAVDRIINRNILSYE